MSFTCAEQIAGWFASWSKQCQGPVGTARPPELELKDVACSAATTLRVLAAASDVRRATRKVHSSLHVPRILQTPNLQLAFFPASTAGQEHLPAVKVNAKGAWPPKPSARLQGQGLASRARSVGQLPCVPRPQLGSHPLQPLPGPIRPYNLAHEM